MNRCAGVSLLLVASLLWSCGNGKRTDDGRTVFRYNESKGITSLDPAQARSMANIWAVAQLFNGLVQLDSALRPVPCIARSWAISEEGTVYDFFLRDDVHFHDSEHFDAGKGRKVTAHDFVRSFQRVLDPAGLSPGRWVFRQVDDDQPFEAVNDTLLRIRLKHPFPPFLSILSMPYCAVVPHEATEALGRDFGRRPVGTGPFRFHAWYEGVKLVMHRNPDYFEADAAGHRLPYLDAVGITFITDPQSVFLEFMKGTLDMLSGLEDGSYKDALITPNGRLRPELADKVMMDSQPFLNTEYLGFQMDAESGVMKGNPLSDRRVRLAIAHGFDRVAMMRYIRNGIGTPGIHGILPDGLAGVSLPEGYAYDPGRSRQLLAEAGYPGGEGLPVITLHTTSQYTDLAEYMQHQLSELGIRLKVDVNPGTAHNALVSSGSSAFFRKSWIADYADPENFLSLFCSVNRAPDGPNYTRFSDATYDRLYSKSMAEPDEAERMRIYSAMDSLLVAHVPFIPLYYDRSLRFTQPGITGLGQSPMNLLSLKQVRKPASQP